MFGSFAQFLFVLYVTFAQFLWLDFPHFLQGRRKEGKEKETSDIPVEGTGFHCRPRKILRSGG